MSETTETVTPAKPELAGVELNPEAGLAGAAAFADAETREILNLLGDSEASGGSCCGGGCCSA